MTNKKRMKAGLLYNPGDEEIMSEQLGYVELSYEYNATLPFEQEKRQLLLKRLFGSIGKGCYIEPPYHANWGGKNVYFGDYVYANFNLTMVDDANIYVGSNTMIAPNVTIATATHPISPKLRAKGIQYNKDVKIGNNVWIGASATILPGVTIGDNSIIGAGSLVNKDIPSNVIAVGNPCRVLRPITERDDFYYDNNKPIDL